MAQVVPAAPTPTTLPFPRCAPCRISGLQSGVYSLLTPVLALAGASYLFAPGMTLAQVFGFAKGVEGFFLWQVGPRCMGGQGSTPGVASAAAAPRRGGGKAP